MFAEGICVSVHACMHSVLCLACINLYTRLGHAHLSVNLPLPKTHRGRYFLPSLYVRMMIYSLLWVAQLFRSTQVQNILPKREVSPKYASRHAYGVEAHSAVPQDSVYTRKGCICMHWCMGCACMSCHPSIHGTSVRIWRPLRIMHLLRALHCVSLA